MNTSSLETTDMFRGAFFMCMGGDLEAIHIRNNGKQIATFLFSGPDLHKHDRAYINGHALVNPVQYREALNHLKDILFENLRKNRNERGRYDRKGKNRAYQKYS